MEMEKKASCVTEKTVDVGGKTYLVKSVFISDKNIQTAIFKLAEKKAARLWELVDDCNIISA